MFPRIFSLSYSDQYFFWTTAREIIFEYYGPSIEFAIEFAIEQQRILFSQAVLLGKNLGWGNKVYPDEITVQFDKDSVSYCVKQPYQPPKLLLTLNPKIKPKDFNLIVTRDSFSNFQALERILWPSGENHELVELKVHRFEKPRKGMIYTPPQGKRIVVSDCGSYYATLE